jgi:hypothetical protein
MSHPQKNRLLNQTLQVEEMKRRWKQVLRKITRVYVQRSLNLNGMMAMMVVVMMKIAILHQLWNLRVMVLLAMMNSHQVLPSQARKVMPQVGIMQVNPWVVHVVAFGFVTRRKPL